MRRPDAGTRAGVESTEGPVGQTDPGAGMSKILVLDDEVRIGRLLSRVLRAEGHAVETAVEGLDGLERAKAGNYDLVLLDLRLPDLDGVSVLRRLVEARPQQSVFVMSAVGTPHARIRCLELGAVDYVSKPFHLRELVLRIRARLRQPPAIQVGRFARAGGVTVDLMLLTADVGSGPVRLSPREFNLLLHLMSHSGRICTRQELLESVWGFSFDPGTNVVDVCVGRLRAKLCPELIETVRNVGYGFQAA